MLGDVRLEGLPLRVHLLAEFALEWPRFEVPAHVNAEARIALALEAALTTRISLIGGVNQFVLLPGYIQHKTKRYSTIIANKIYPTYTLSAMSVNVRKSTFKHI